MIAPSWLSTETQPIAVDDVLSYMEQAPGVPESAGREVQIGGPDVLSYGDMLDRMAEVLDRRRRPKVPVPFLTSTPVVAVDRARHARGCRGRAPADRGALDSHARHRPFGRGAVRRGADALRSRRCAAPTTRSRVPIRSLPVVVTRRRLPLLAFLVEAIVVAVRLVLVARSRLNQGRLRTTRSHEPLALAGVASTMMSLKSANTTSNPGPQATLSGWPSRVRNVSLPGPPFNVSPVPSGASLSLRASAQSRSSPVATVVDVDTAIGEHDVVAVSAIRHVIAFAADHEVVARSAIRPVVPGSGEEPVEPGPAARVSLPLPPATRSLPGRSGRRCPCHRRPGRCPVHRRPHRRPGRRTSGRSLRHPTRCRCRGTHEPRRSPPTH